MRLGALDVKPAVADHRRGVRGRAGRPKELPQRLLHHLFLFGAGAAQLAADHHRKAVGNAKVV